MYLVAIAWMFVVVCMAAVEATTSSLIGGLGTLLLYGILPLGLVLWLLGTPQRRRARDGGRKVVAGASFTPGRRHRRGDDETDDPGQ